MVEKVKSPFVEAFHQWEMGTHPNRVVLKTPEGDLTADRLSNLVRSLWALCQLRGVVAGSAVVLCSRSDLLTVGFFLSCLRLGLVVVVVDPSTPSPELQEIITRTSARMLAIDVSRRTEVDPGPGCWLLPLQVEEARTKPSLFQKLLGKKEAAPTSDTWPSLGRGLVSSDPLPEPGIDDLAYILFTSGSTASPRGVMFRHGAAFAHASTLARVLKYDTSSLILSPGPLHHTDGIYHGMLPLWVGGATCVRAGRFTVQGLPHLLDLIHREGITHLITVPTLFALIDRLSTPDVADLPHTALRVVISTAGYLDEGRWREFEARFGVKIHNLYGLTESGSGSVYCGPDPSTRKVGTLGKPIDCDIKIVDEGGMEVAPGVGGELLLRGPHLMAAYLGEEAPGLLDGWLHTGDRVHLDDDGFVVMEGRIKNIVVRGGANIQPLRVMSTLASLEGVVENYVCGMTDPVWGERLVAVVVGATLDTERVMAHCRQHLSSDEIPDEVYFLPGLPLTSSGKVDGRRIKEMLLQRKESPEVAGSLRERIYQLAARCFRVEVAHLSPHSSAENTPGWDSLAHMELVNQLERHFSIRLTPRDILRMKTLQDVEQRVGDHHGDASRG